MTPGFFRLEIQIHAAMTKITTAPATPPMMPPRAGCESPEPFVVRSKFVNEVSQMDFMPFVEFRLGGRKVPGALDGFATREVAVPDPPDDSTTGDGELVADTSELVDNIPPWGDSVGIVVTDLEAAEM